VKRGFKIAVLTGAALLCVAAAPKSVGWSSTVSLTPEGYNLLGNPKAAVRLTEYVSYTCAGCARFQMQADGVLLLAYLPSGRVAIEVHPVIESPIDLTAAMLANCGPREKFFMNHNALLRSQVNWIKPLAHASSVQRSRWSGSILGARNRAIAADFGLYTVMATRGYDRQSVERCLNDQAMAARITTQSVTAKAKGVTKTPSFSLGGDLLKDTHDWASLRPQLDESLN
jgi:protein-disulfide isomerase